MRWKLFLLTIPLAIAVIVSVLIAGYKINKTEAELTNVYYGTLYQVNSNLLNADRDFYQSISAAAKVHEVLDGLLVLPEPVFNAAVADYQDNRDQVLERVKIDGIVKVAQYGHVLIDVAEVERYQAACLRVLHHTYCAACVKHQNRRFLHCCYVNKCHFI